MKKILFCLFSCFSIFWASAQVGLVLQANTKTIIFGDKVNVRETPNKDGKVLTQLTAGEVVTVIDTTNQYWVQNGRKDYWYKIRLSGNKTGFLWGGLLSYGSDTLLQKDVKFAYNFTEVKKRKNPEEGKDVSVELRAIRGGQVIAKTTFIIENMTEENQTSSSINPTGGGLKSVKALLHIHIGYPACGYTQHEIVSLWDGTQFTTLPALQSMGDSGVVGYSENYIFPNHLESAGVENKIIYEVIHYEALGDGEEGESNEYKIRRILKRKGQQYVKPKMPEVKF